MKDKIEKLYLSPRGSERKIEIPTNAICLINIGKTKPDRNHMLKST